MDFDEMLSRSGSPNAEVDCYLSGDTFSVLPLAAAIDVDNTVKLIDSGAGLGPSGSVPPVYLGYAQNAPAPGSPAVVRVSGFTRVIYGGTVAVGDLLRLEPSTGRVIPFSISGGDGHVHDLLISIIRRVVYVVDDNAIQAWGVAPGNFTTVLEWDNAGTLTGASEAVTVTEIGSGEYMVSFTPTTSDAMYRLRVSCNPDGVHRGICEPQEFQMISSARVLGPVEGSLQLIIGQALVSGVADDVGLMIIRNQIF